VKYRNMLEMNTDPAPPQTAKTAAEVIAEGKVIVFFNHTGEAPELRSKKFKLGISYNFQYVTEFLRKQLKFTDNQPLCLFVQRSFQPTPDQSIEDLVKCFLGTNGVLTINYSLSPAWG